MFDSPPSCCIYPATRNLNDNPVYKNSMLSQIKQILMISKWKYFKTENQCNKLFYDIPIHAISMLLNNTVYEKCKLQCTLNCYHKCS